MTDAVQLDSFTFSFVVTGCEGSLLRVIAGEGAITCADSGSSSFGQDMSVDTEGGSWTSSSSTGSSPSVKPIPDDSSFVASVEGIVLISVLSVVGFIGAWLCLYASRRGRSSPYTDEEDDVDLLEMAESE